MIEALIDLLVAALLLVGTLFALVAALGLVRLPDLYTRMHAASKAGTLGSGVLLVALAIADGTGGTASRALAGVVFFLLTAPISAHLLAKAAYGVGYKLWSGSVLDEMAPSMETAPATGAPSGPAGRNAGADAASSADYAPAPSADAPPRTPAETPARTPVERRETTE